MHLHKSQSWWTLTVETNFADIATAVEIRILYKNPKGRKGYWTPDSLNGTDMIYAVQDGDIDEYGVWELQSWAEGPDGRIALGKIEKHTFVNPLL